MDNLHEIVKFLQLGSRSDIKAECIKQILGLTGNEEGLDIILKSKPMIKTLLSLIYDPSSSIAKNTSSILINISASEEGAKTLIDLDIETESSLILKPPDNIIVTCLKMILDSNNALADEACMILSNLTRPSANINKIIDMIEQSGVKLDKLISLFTTVGYNKKGAKLHYLGPVFSNLSQSSQIRKYILDKDKCVIQRLLPFTEFKESVIRREGIIGTLKNCCFEQDCHEWLLSSDVDILPRLLLPLAGNEEFDDEDNDKLPSELQYLPEDKMREENSVIRKMLLEALMQLCATKEIREILRNKNVYVILRELHKWEKDREVLLACENVVDVLIRTEDEIGEENIAALEVPKELHDKFHQMDNDFLKDS